MTIQAWTLLGVYLLVLVALAWPLASWLTTVMEGRFTFGKRIEAPLYRLAGVKADTEMGWLQYVLALLLFNILGLLVVYALQRLQAFLPLNPQGFGAVSPDSSFNTAASFVTNTNWQGYSGEATMSYLTQMLALAVQNFLSAASGIVVVMALIRGFARHSATSIGNIWADLTRVTLWVLLPLSLIFGLFFVSQGVIQNFEPYKEVATLEVIQYQSPKLDASGQPMMDAQGKAVMQDTTSHTQTLAMGPVASQEAIKMLGTNGGGFFNTNSAHPYENPTALADRIGEFGADLDVVQIALPALQRTRPEKAAIGGESRVAWPAYAMSAAICAATTLLATPLLRVFELANIVMLFLLAVVGIAVRYGRGPAILAAFFSVGAFDFFFVSPRFSFAISDVQYLVTFGVMLVVALVIGQMTAGLTYQARVAQKREDRIRALYEISRQLSAALMTEQVAEIGTRFLADEFNARSALLVADDNDKLQTPMTTGDAPEVDSAIAQWSFDKVQAAGQGTDTLPASPTLYLPLSAPMRVRGVLAVQPRDATRLGVPEQRRLLDTCASLLAISLERIHYVNVAQDTTVQMESERLRNSLLAAISHDLRTPLTAMVGLAETLTLTKPSLTGEPVEIAHAIRESALRMNILVNNLLDMARLESGAVALNLQWQPLEEVVGSSLRAIRPALGVRPVQVALPEDLPLVHIDAVLIERVLVNLLENAGKYTPPDTPIRIGAAATDDTVELWVDDYGPGLPRGHEEAIFSKFERGKKESAIPGVGLGLAISRAIAQAHGGTVLGVTRPEGGARFTLRLPRTEPPIIELSPEPTDED
ncbi:potassium-transporting ATPase subunit KdpA [Pseudomonas fluorescens]|uniref:histidine kinase n=1 Tax=Pseudomonas fluorescens TaxID=294 RepID=A0A5E7EIR9_PSEFL|nr:potassium-transporting ATPase subunit KdpA [Pseudomonas fluorescens]VVO26785.1 Potassium-transporting ATPase potassium-binding subunit [Pseudomonas fluorescens]